MANVEQVRLSLSYHRGFLQPICSRCDMLQPLQRGQLRLLHAALEFCRKWLLKWKQKSRKPRPSKRQKNLRAVRAVNSHDVEFQGEMQNDSDGTRLYKTLQDFTRLTWVRVKIQGMDQGPEPTHDPYPPIHTLIHTLWYCMIHTLDPYS